VGVGTDAMWLMRKRNLPTWQLGMAGWCLQLLQLLKQFFFSVQPVHVESFIWKERISACL
jgi:hypothetical protein